jgi:hypothetical protein
MLTAANQDLVGAVFVTQLGSIALAGFLRTISRSFDEISIENLDIRI